MTQYGAINALKKFSDTRFMSPKWDNKLYGSGNLEYLILAKRFEQVFLPYN